MQLQHICPNDSLGHSSRGPDGVSAERVTLKRNLRDMTRISAVHLAGKFYQKHQYF